MFGKFFKKTKEKVNSVIDTAEKKIEQVAESTDKFISEGNNQMKIITYTVVIFGIVNIVSNAVSIYTNLRGMNVGATPKVVNNIYINGIKK